MIFALAVPTALFFTYRNSVKEDNLQFTTQEKINLMMTYNMKDEDLKNSCYVYHSKAYQSFIDSHGILL